jgi:dolichyl-phosphate-mannose--protein O-mannosyl transferase
LIPLTTYLLSWSGWFFTSTGWKRNSSANPLAALWNYHLEIFSFHRKLTQDHPYSANPFGWLWLRRPTSFYFESEKLGTSCGASKCAQEILAIGTPVLWWIAGISIIFLLFELLRFRTVLSISIFAPLATLYLPWLLLTHRTTFYFYSITFLPFLILAIGYLLYRLKDLKPEYELFSLWLPITIVAVVAANYLYFLPIYMGLNISYSAWLKLMWLSSWI